MELSINSPAYYTSVYGVDDEIYWMCRGLAQYFKEKEYSKIINRIGIVPIVAPEKEYKKGLWKEIKTVELRSGFASISLRMNYQEYIDADMNKKKGMIIDNILASIKAIKVRAKIDYDSFENDIKEFCVNNNIV